MRLILFFSFLFFFFLSQAQIRVEKVAELPEAVSNNAVCEGFINDFPLIFSFGGIDSSLEYSGIHQRSYRYNILTDEVDRLPDLPDTLGKIAMAASRVGDIIYIMGGYHVFEDGRELSSNRVHRYDIKQNIFLSDGEPIPVATDDQVQVVWRDSLIYLISGWNNTQNINLVQVYDPKFDQWAQAKAVPNQHPFKSFGASGVIIKDSIFYFGGAASTQGFPIQNWLRKGVINPANHLDIDWSVSTPDRNISGYRMAACNVLGIPHWVGGSEETYNFDALSYRNAQVVNPINRDLYLDLSEKKWESTGIELPMDLRGIAEVSDTIKYLAGGIKENKVVSKDILKLHWTNLGTGIKEFYDPKRVFFIYPNPFSDYIRVQAMNGDDMISRVELFTMQGYKVYDRSFSSRNPKINFSKYRERAYIIRIWNTNAQSYVDKILRR